MDHDAYQHRTNPSPVYGTTCRLPRDHPCDAETTADFVDLSREGGGICRVAREDFDGYRAAVRGTKQAVHNLRFTRFAVAAVTHLDQFGLPSGVVAGANVIEHERAVFEMLLREFVVGVANPSLHTTPAFRCFAVAIRRRDCARPFRVASR